MFALKIEYNKKGVSYSRRGYYRKAVDEFEKAIKLDPNFSVASDKLKTALCKIALEESPLVDFRQVATHESDKSATINQEGIQLAKKSCYDGAIEKFEYALELDDWFSPARYNLGICCFLRGRLKEASYCFQKYGSHHPNDMASVYNLRKVNLRFKLYYRALSAFTTAIDLDPEDPSPYANTAIPLVGLQMYDEAERYVNKALDLNPKLSSAHGNKGYVYMEQKEWAEAISHFTRALKLDPKSVELWNNLGICHARIGQYRVAMRALKKASSLDNKNEAVFKNREAVRNLLHRKLFGAGAVGRYLGIVGAESNYNSLVFV